MNKKFIEALGSRPFRIDVRDYKLRKSPKVGEYYPKEFSLDTIRVKSQGSVSSCVAHAICEVNEYHNRRQERTNRVMSTGFIYGNRRNSLNKSSGMYVREALSNMCKYGNVLKEDFSENVEVPEAISLFEDKFELLKDKAYPNRFSSYFRLSKIDDIKYSLMNYGPVVFAMNWREGITVNKDGVMQINKKANKTGGHCMMIYGWNEKGWLIQNSWGISWGKEGRAILPFDIKLSEVWGVTDEITYENSDIKKSNYNTTFKRFIAKVLNFFLNLFRGK